jgi:hypothetical protein
MYQATLLAYSILGFEAGVAYLGGRGGGPVPEMRCIPGAAYPSFLTSTLRSIPR